MAEIPDSGILLGNNPTCWSIQFWLFSSEDLTPNITFAAGVARSKSHVTVISNAETTFPNSVVFPNEKKVVVAISTVLWDSNDRRRCSVVPCSMMVARSSRSF